MVGKKIVAEDIANWFIAKANQEVEHKKSKANSEVEYPEGISHLKLQKILYFSQAAHLALKDNVLFEDKIEAWDFGPVVVNVYHKFKGRGNLPIDKPTNQKYSQNIDEDTADFLEQMWQIFGEFSATRLVNITHKHRPWMDAYKKDKKEIYPEVMKSYYKNVFREA